MTTIELIILIIPSIALGVATGVMVTLTVMRHLLHTKDARIKILNEQLEKMITKSTDQVQAAMVVYSEHQKAMDTYWETEKELIQEDKRTGPTC